MENNVNQLLTVNQLYQRSTERDNGISFKDWLDPLKKEYARASNSFDDKPGMDFINWINNYEEMKESRIHQQNINRARKNQMKTKETFENASDAVPPKNEKEQEARRQEALKDNSIFGLNPIAFYSIVGVSILAIGTGIYFYVKNKKGQ